MPVTVFRCERWGWRLFTGGVQVRIRLGEAVRSITEFGGPRGGSGSRWRWLPGPRFTRKLSRDLRMCDGEVVHSIRAGR